MLVTSKKGKVYDPHKSIIFSSRMITALTMELQYSNESDYNEFLQKEIDRHQNLVKLCKNKIYFLTKKTK
jgi:hypothetical protein